MSNWSDNAQVANSALLQIMGDTITYTPDASKSLAAFTFTAVTELGFDFEERHANQGFHALLGSVQYSDISKGLVPGELDITTLQGDTCSFGSPSYTYRVQIIGNPDLAGTLTIYLRKLPFES